MAVDRETQAVYDANAERYHARVARDVEDFAGHLEAFAARVPPGGRVLDLGCGPGWAAHWFAERGFAVHAVDASPGLAEIARQKFGIEVEIADFTDLVAEAAYDGIWASFSLLHLPREEMPAMLARIARAARPGAALYLGMKEGEGEGRDSLGRFYTYYRADDLAALLTGAGFTPRESTSDRGTGLSGEVSTGLHLIATRDA